jgi:serine/threonine protein kinase
LNGLAQDAKNLQLVMEFIRGGELFTYLRGVRYFPVKQAQVYAAQIVSIFEYIHSMDIIYR